MVKKRCTCPRLDEARLLRCNFVLQVYSRPKYRIYRCARCGKRGSKSLAITILSTLCQPPEDLSFISLIRLRAAFWSMTGNVHGTKDSTSFHIIGIEESSSGVLCTVFTKHNQRKVLNTSKEELLNMVDDPLLEIESTVTEAVEAIWPLPVRHSIGGKAPRIHTNTKPKTLKWFTCWCCDKMMSEYVEEPEHFGNITPCQDDLSVVAKDNEDTKEFGLTASRSTFDIFVPIDTKSSNESVSGAGTNY